MSETPSPKIFLLLALLPWPLAAIPLYGLHDYRLALLAYHGLCLAAWLRYGRRAPMRWQDVRVWIRPSLALALVNVVALRAVIDVLPMRDGMRFFGYHPSHLWPLLGYFLLVQPLAEELFWRATVFEGLSKTLGTARAALLSSLLFGTWHGLVLWVVTPSLCLLGVAAVTLFGTAMSALYVYRDRSVGACTLVHAIGGDLPLVVVLALVF